MFCKREITNKYKQRMPVNAFTNSFCKMCSCVLVCLVPGNLIISVPFSNPAWYCNVLNGALDTLFIELTFIDRSWHGRHGHGNLSVRSGGTSGKLCTPKRRDAQLDVLEFLDDFHGSR